MLVNYAMPVRDIAVLFRPQVWGYFLSVDRGLAFQWWFHAIGVWLALFLLLKVLTRGDLLVSCSGATALLFSPFFQYWSLNCAPTIIFSIGTLLSARTLWKANTLRYLAVATLALAWFTTAFLLTFSFMPYLVTAAYLVAFLFPGMIMMALRQDHGELKTTLRIAGLASAVSLMMLVVSLVQKDLIWIELHPQNPRFKALSVDYLFYSGKHAEWFEIIPNLRKVFQYAGKTIFEVK